MTQHDHATDRNEQIRKLHDLIKDFHVAMLTTTAADGRIFSRPLGTQDVEFDGDLWFATGLDSEKVREIEANPRVNVAYASQDKNEFVSISGRASIVRDRATIDEKWGPGMSIFFKEGKDDPNLCLIRVEAESAEYWDGPGSAIGKGLYFVSAALTKNPGVMSENERVDLRH